MVLLGCRRRSVFVCVRRGTRGEKEREGRKKSIRGEGCVELDADGDLFSGARRRDGNEWVSVTSVSGYQENTHTRTHTLLQPHANTCFSANSGSAMNQRHKHQHTHKHTHTHTLPPHTHTSDIIFDLLMFSHRNHQQSQKEGMQPV